jgi:hypothetical protein
VALFRAKKEYDRALSRLAAGCDVEGAQNRGLACNLAGAIHSDGLGHPRDPKKAFPFFEKACNAGSADGCSNAGNALKSGRGIPRDTTKADEMFAKACKHGSKKHCN